MKVYNFCSGPAVLPDEVLAEASRALINWEKTGTSILGISHRSPEFQKIAYESEQDLRSLLAIPDTYHVLFLAGGASAQFAMVPMNLLGSKTSAHYIDTGYWSKMAIKEAQKYCDVLVTAQGAEAVSVKSWHSDKATAYIHCVPNETVEGIAISPIPEDGGAPIVADMSSCLLSTPIDVSQYGLIYAGSHKNIGAAGMTIVIVRKDLLKPVLANTPSLYNYQVLANAKSLYNTPPTFAWYTAGLVFKWLLKQGGLPEMARRNEEKAALLYDFIDQSQLYSNQVPKNYRSITNITFKLIQPELEPIFLAESKSEGLLHLKGHRSVGGCRASLYNAMPIEGVMALVQFMREFEYRHVRKT